MVVGDVYNIEERLQEFDPNLSLELNELNGNYIVLFKDQYVMEWQRPLDARLIKHMRKIDSHRGYDALKEIDEYNEKLDKSNERDRYNYLEAVVKDYKKQIAREI
ncbi:hypothetical protein [Desulfitobacterium metallireducens]|uniref:Uncharacterized protein n=1 Tax=Desulfitobacterium metallireducens DSM 15288 TaxID=871968 RepID=W0ECF4_9FIRM|nr:hypothetical protein [Desulfitobacterium metallireducens]AHF08565.1 hypothetical protein DESME_08895 [Desulfitobacterium metallireducens DSM 15288]